MRRDIKAPFLFSSGSLETAASEEAKWREDYAQAYLSLAPDDNWTLAIAYQYEMQDYTEQTAVNDVSRLKTKRVPLSLRYFSENGFSAGVRVSHVDQEIQQFDTINQIGENDQEQFWIVDASLVYRLPKRYGFVSLEVKNLFNEEFRFQEPDPDIATVYPDRFFLVKLSLNFN
jgi:outer membrane receptor for ferric coprogen and ferric-rhodotorulic acid